MKRFLLGQSLFVPLAAMLVPILMAFDAPHYSSWSQHVSELQLLDHPVATVMRIAPILSGVSVLLFGIGAYLVAPSRYPFTALTSAAVAANFISAGIYVSGSPMHGLYGVGYFMPLVPACFAAESGLGHRVARTSLACAALTMAYLWLNASGLDPYRGVTQRLAIGLVFGWYGYAGHQLLRAMRSTPKDGRVEAPVFRAVPART